MNIFNTVVSFIDTLGVVQGLLFGVMLILLHSKKNKPTLFLGVFIILFSLEPIPNILQDLNILAQYPKWELLPVGFYFSAYPLFYIYIQKISILGDEQPSYWTLIPGIIEFIIATVIFFLPSEIKLEIKASLLHALYFFTGLCYSLIIAYLILKQIHQHIREVECQYTSLYNKTLTWSKWFIYLSIFFHFLILINFFLDNYMWYAFMTITNVILIYWVSFKGITQENITYLRWVEAKSGGVDVLVQPIEKDMGRTKKEPLSLISKPAQQLISQEEAKKIYNTVEDFVVQSRCFVNDKLTIVDIAEATSIHPKRISYAINSIKSLNFNTYINSFRVEYAKQLLKDIDKQNLSIEGVGLDAGFHSKTTFYNAFKRFENMTPAQFRSS